MEPTNPNGQFQRQRGNERIRIHHLGHEQHVVFGGGVHGLGESQLVARSNEQVYQQFISLQ